MRSMWSAECGRIDVGTSMLPLRGDLGIVRGSVPAKGRGKAKGTKERAKGPRDFRRELKEWGSLEAKTVEKGKVAQARD